MTGKSRNINVTFQYGIATGHRNGKRFRQALQSAGYTVVADASQADIIIGHSAGCFQLPAAPTHQKLMLIDPPYWPGKSASQRGKQRLRSNLQYRQYNYPLGYWASRNVWGVYYLLRHFRRSRWIFRHVNQYDLSSIIQNHTAMLVRNYDDDWLTPELDTLAASNPTLLIRHLPGDHDDCLFNPQPYVRLLKELELAKDKHGSD